MIFHGSVLNNQMARLFRDDFFYDSSVTVRSAMALHAIEIGREHREAGGVADEQKATGGAAQPEGVNIQDVPKRWAMANLRKRAWIFGNWSVDIMCIW